MQNQKEPTMLSIGRASEYLGVSIDTLRRWEKREKIVVYRSPGGHRYFRKEDLDNLFGTKYQRDTLESEEEEKLETKSPKPSKNGKKEYKTVTEIADREPPVYEQIGRLLQRPIRQFYVPQSEPIAIRSAKYEAQTYESRTPSSVYSAQSQSVEVNTLLPKISLEDQEKLPQKVPSDQPKPQKTAQPTTPKKGLINKTNVLAILIITSIITACLALILYFYSLPNIISPLPSAY